jgi:hypothetical protein
MDTKYYMVFDVESIGLHGIGFAVGGGAFYKNGAQMASFLFSCSPENLKGNPEDIEWVNENIPLLEVTHRSPRQVRKAFWETWLEYKKIYPGIVMVAECPWPVETNFLSACIQDDPTRAEEAPYPLYDVSSIMFACDEDPLATWQRKEAELPVHDPLADSNLSARILTSLIQ